jgi:hypothetical protein
MDNTGLHRSEATSGYLKEFAFWCFPYLPFSRDMALSDFYLFGAIKGQLSGSKFRSAEELASVVTDMSFFVCHIGERFPQMGIAVAEMCPYGLRVS